MPRPTARAKNMKAQNGQDRLQIIFFPQRAGWKIQNIKYKIGAANTKVIPNHGKLSLSTPLQTATSAWRKWEGKQLGKGDNQLLTINTWVLLPLPTQITQKHAGIMLGTLQTQPRQRPSLSLSKFWESPGLQNCGCKQPVATSLPFPIQPEKPSKTSL